MDISNNEHLITVRSADGTPIAFEKSGEGPPVVLVHGAILPGITWRFVVPFLQQHFTVYTMDRRGRGRSSDSPDYAPAREIEDILAGLDYIGEPASLVGHSSGAVLCMMVAERRNAHIRKMVLYEPPLIRGSEQSPHDLPARLKTLILNGKREEAFDTFMREGPGISEADLAQMKTGRAWPLMLGVAHTTMYDSQIVEEYDIDPEVLARITIPVLVLIGGESRAGMKKASESVAEALPDSYIHILHGQAHSAQQQAPEMLAGEIVSFLKDNADV